MIRGFIITFGVLLVATLPSLACAAGAEPSAWEPTLGDRVVVDVSRSIVYLVHPDGASLALDGLTGQKRVVSYDGITYNAATPERSWELRSDALEKKGRSMTFGDGRFFRLSWPGHRDNRRGDESTAYGFHSHLSFQKMLEEKHGKKGWDREGTGHRSMGCILLSEDDLTLLEQTWHSNGNFLEVTTQASVDPLAFQPATQESTKPSWLGMVGE